MTAIFDTVITERELYEKDKTFRYELTFVSPCIFDGILCSYAAGYRSYQ